MGCFLLDKGMKGRKGEREEEEKGRRGEREKGKKRRRGEGVGRCSSSG